MNTYRIVFELCYPDSREDIRTAYVLAKDFQQAHDKVVKRFKSEYEMAHVHLIEKTEDAIII